MRFSDDGAGSRRSTERRNSGLPSVSWRFRNAPNGTSEPSAEAAAALEGVELRLMIGLLYPTLHSSSTSTHPCDIAGGCLRQRWGTTALAGPNPIRGADSRRGLVLGSDGAARSQQQGHGQGGHQQHRPERRA